MSLRKRAKMFLAVDVGNTQTVLGLYEDERLLAHWRIATVATDTSDELDVRIRSLLALGALDSAAITDVGIASVVPPLTEQWHLVAARHASAEPLILDSTLDIGLPIAYANPSEIGADRLADAVAAIKLYGAPVIVVDFGTATNIEVIDKTGTFLGGVIAPGLVTSAEALFNAAARLAKTSIEVPATVIGSTTKTAVQSGLTFGEIDRIDGLIRRVFDELGYKATVVATGGLSARVIDLSTTIDIVNDNLTLEGLRLIYQRVCGCRFR
ncbi:MAG: type III pantothenate kinase [Coriobacteriales bacterium]|jgi:type III pantothenate kinase|nr:type III pantothenate kinase [Coriobacteriales bacterium]